MMTSNDPFEDISAENRRTTKPGNSKLQVSVDEKNKEGVLVSNGMKHSDNEESLSLVSSPRSFKRNASVVKKKSNKLVAAIKSLQCSPRVDAGDYGKLEERKNKGSSSISNSNNAVQYSNHQVEDIPSNLQQQQQQQQQQQHSHQQPVFVANFDNFEPMHDQSHLIKKGFVSENLEFEKVLVKLDNLDPNTMSTQSFISNDLEIFTNDTEGTDDINKSGRENGEKREENDNDDDNNDLWNITRLSQNKTEENAYRQDIGKLSSSAFAVSGWNEVDGSTPPSSSMPKPLIQNEFSQFSNDSNDTPVTCNKSVILTPNNESLYYSRKKEEENGSETDFYCKPPKEILHRSLSLGDSLSPTEEDSPCRSDLSIGVSEASCSEALKSKNMLDDNDNNFDYKHHRQTGHPSQQQIETLQLPIMNCKRGALDSSFAEENVLRRVKQIEKGQPVPPFFSKTILSSSHSDTCTKSSDLNTIQATQKVASNENKGRSTLQDDVSAISSTVSSFVFSSDNGHNLECKVNQAVVNSEPISPAIFWKTRPHEQGKREMHQKVHYAGAISEPTSPAFFWKTHPRVTIKSYHFQQRKAIIRKVNSKLKSGRSIHHHIGKAAIS